MGRQGLSYLGGQSTVATNIGYISNTHPDLIRTTDVCGVAVLNELKTDYDRLSKVFHSIEYGSFIRSLQDPIIGGTAGGVEGATIVGIASILLGSVVNHATYHTIHPVHRKYLATSCRMGLYLESIVGQAFARNSQILVTGNIFLAAGPGEKMLLQEVAANAITISVSGLNLGPGVPSALSKYTDHMSGLESIFAAEVGRATADANLSRSDANDLVKWLLSQYEPQMENPPIGFTFQECYDVARVQPKNSWMKIRDEMVLELSKRGLAFSELM
jgi:methylamine--corrinoid protein Co-methyltransferase